MGAEVFLIHTSVLSQGSMAVQKKEDRRRRSRRKKKMSRGFGLVCPGCCEVPDCVLEPPRLGPFPPLPLPVISHYLIHAPGSVYDHRSILCHLNFSRSGLNLFKPVRKLTPRRTKWPSCSFCQALFSPPLSFFMFVRSRFLMIHPATLVLRGTSRQRRKSSRQA